MVYRKENYNVNKDGKTVTEGQTFDKYYQKYRLNQATGMLEDAGKVDIQELVNSNLDSCLSRVIERYLPGNDIDDQVGEYDAMRDDLDYLFEAGNIAEDLKERYGLDDSLSISEVYDQVSVRANALKKDIDAKIQAHSGENIEKSEVLDNEKKTEQEGEQA